MSEEFSLTDTMRIVCVKALCLMCLMIALRLDEVTAEKKQSLKARIGCKYSKLEIYRHFEGKDIRL